MRRLSSRLTPFYKWAMPVPFVLAMGLLIGLSLFAPRGPRPGPELWLILTASIVSFGVAWAVYRVRLGGVADEVWLDGETLRVRRGERTARIALADIINVNSTRYGNPPRIDLSVRGGRNVAFIPAARPSLWRPFALNPVAQELIARIDDARGAASSAPR